MYGNTLILPIYFSVSGQALGGVNPTTNPAYSKGVDGGYVMKCRGIKWLLALTCLMPLLPEPQGTGSSCSATARYVGF